MTNQAGEVFQNRWKIVRELGAGGQGRVYQVEDLKNSNERETLEAIKRFLGNAQGIITHATQQEENAIQIRNAVLDIISDSKQQKYALKILLDPKDAVAPDAAKERMRNEIQALNECEHWHIVDVVEAYPDEYAYVMPFIPLTLYDARHRFEGKPLESLIAFRHLVDAARHIHSKGLVHRDIKPENIFVKGRQKDLVLADFGIVFFRDDEKTRPSETFENVGTRKFMPDWAQDRRIDEVSPYFDIDSLGRLLWWMISGNEPLRRWYFDDPRYSDLNLEQIHSDAPGIELINPILSKCIHQHEDDAQTDAVELLSSVDAAIASIRQGGSIIHGKCLCKACSKAHYRLIADRDRSKTEMFFNNYSGHTFRIFECPNCGHIQFFHFGMDDRDDLPEWQDSKR